MFIVEAGRAQSVSVQTGISDGRWIEIASGSSGDEDVVVVGKRKLVDRSLVSPAPFNLPEGKPAQQKFERRLPGASGPTAAYTEPAQPKNSN